MSNPRPRPRAVIFGCAGPVLTAAERDFFRDADPFGFVLFRRNCVEPAQLTDLVEALRDAVGRPDAPVLIDQEGGRVQRLRPPHWRAAPAGARFAALAAIDIAAATRAAWLHARLLADDLMAHGIDVDCLPVLDLPVPGASDVIGDRAIGHDAQTIIRLGRAMMDGLLDGGVLPVIKHLPGHGRALVDSHLALPVVDAPADRLIASDLVPFQALADAPIGMTAHIVYTAWDDRPATLSERVIGEIIRGEIGFDGLLLSDDLGMSALGGDFGARAADAIAAGCDVALHCGGDMAEMRAVVGAIGPLDDRAAARADRALAARRAPDPIDRAALLGELEHLITGMAA